jgi:tetratricopeptide (TPR) repeat protein
MTVIRTSFALAVALAVPSPALLGQAAGAPAAGFDAVFGYELPAEAEDGSGLVHRLDETELRIWNDPDFQRRFIESYMAVSEVEPRVTEVERPHMQKVLELISGDKLAEAQDLIRKHNNDAASAVFDFTLANIHFQSEDLERAGQAYEAAVRKFPRFQRAWRNLALVHIRQADFQPAADAFTRVIELGGGDAVTYGLLGYAYSNVENHLSAESAYRMALLLDPQTMDWKMGLARSFFKQSRFADAVALLGRLIEDQPERTDLWLLQANAFLGLGQPMRAAENYELVDGLGGSTAESLNMLGDIYVNEELFDLAVAGYERAMDKDPKADPARSLRAAKVLAARGAFAETRRLVEHIEALHGARLEDAQRKDLLKLRARLAVAEGSGDEEARVLEEIVSLDPLDGEALILLGQHSGRAGDIERAIFWYERAESLEAHEADAKVRHAQLLVGQGRYAEALPLLRRAQAIKPRENVQAYIDQVERVAQAR